MCTKMVADERLQTNTESIGSRRVTGEQDRLRLGCEARRDPTIPFAISWSIRSGKTIAHAGFSLAELLLVVAIISILAAIALPAYRDYVIRSEVAEGLVFLGDAKIAVNDFYSRWGRMPANNEEAGLRAPEDLQGNYLQGLSVSDGSMVATLALGKGHKRPAMYRTLTFQPFVNDEIRGSPVVWSCGGKDPELSNGYHAIGNIAEDPVDSRWLPSICRK
ncbi:pilin [Dokdonella sp.]|uniref:pilin n=1 Tax=Dokdonella sp. TaxID=2291710 RepID=UPI003528A957